MKWRVEWIDKEGNAQTYTAYREERAVDEQRKLKKQGIESKVFKYDFKGNLIGEVKNYDDLNMAIAVIGVIIAFIMWNVSLPAFVLVFGSIAAIMGFKWVIKNAFGK